MSPGLPPIVKLSKAIGDVSRKTFIMAVISSSFRSQLSNRNSFNSVFPLRRYSAIFLPESAILFLVKITFLRGGVILSSVLSSQPEILFDPLNTLPESAGSLLSSSFPSVVILSTTFFKSVKFC